MKAEVQRMLLMFLDMIAEEDINMEEELEQLSLSSADGVSNGSNISLEMSDEEILDHLYQEKERLALRKRHAARLLALSSPLEQGNNEKAYAEARQQLDNINVKIGRLEESMTDVASSKQACSTGRERQLGNEPKETKSGKKKPLKITDDMPRFYDSSNAREFLNQLRHVVMAYVGKDTSEEDC